MRKQRLLLWVLVVATLFAFPCSALAAQRYQILMIGDQDEVRIEHAVELFRALPEAELAIVPGTSHGLLVEKPELCNAMILGFLT